MNLISRFPAALPSPRQHRKTGKLTKEFAFIKVHGDIALLEKFATESKFRVNSDEGDEPVNFTPDAKVASALTHPGCTCVEEHGKRDECARCHTTHCACCKSRHVDGAECNGGVCTCELFYPYQRSELVHSLILEALGAWTVWALEQRAAKAADADDARDLREAAAHMRPAQALTVALRWKLLLDAFPLHTLNKKETSQFYQARDEFAHSVLAGLHLTGTSSSTKFVTFFREYFGEKIALYFAFLHYYNLWMIFLGSPALALAIYTWVTNATDNPLVRLSLPCRARNTFISVLLL